MPAAAPVTHKANQILDGTDPVAQGVAREAVAGASTVHEAIERVGLLEGMGDPIVAEARLVLAQLPQAIDQALLAALRSALERRIPVGVEWEQGEEISLRITEATRGHVLVVLVTPHGSTYS
jgi:hypothetical protein